MREEQLGITDVTSFTLWNHKTVQAKHLHRCIVTKQLKKMGLTGWSTHKMLILNLRWSMESGQQLKMDISNM